MLPDGVRASGWDSSVQQLSFESVCTHVIGYRVLHRLGNNQLRRLSWYFSKGRYVTEKTPVFAKLPPFHEKQTQSNPDSKQISRSRCSIQHIRTHFDAVQAEPA